MSKGYKLVEITYEEHLTLADAGVWVQWDVNFSGERGWCEEGIRVTANSDVRRQKSCKLGFRYKFYTRVEIDDELQ